MLESQIQRNILDYLAVLESQGYLTYIRNNSFAGHIQRRNGSQGYIKNKKPGSADIIMCINGHFIALEVKTDIGKQSILQVRYQELLEKCGGVYRIVRSIDDVQTIIKEYS